MDNDDSILHDRLLKMSISLRSGSEANMNRHAANTIAVLLEDAAIRIGRESAAAQGLRDDDLTRAADYLADWAEHIQVYNLGAERSPFDFIIADALKAKKDEMLALVKRLRAASLARTSPATSEPVMPVAPSGWQLVPIEPTPEMMEAALRESGEWVEEYTSPRESGVPTECDITQEDADKFNQESMDRLGHDYRAAIAAAPVAPSGAREDAPVSTMQALKAALQGAPSYAWSWHCNLAMPIMDWAHVDAYVANDVAASLMQYLFDIDTRKNENWNHDAPIPAETPARAVQEARQIVAEQADDEGLWFQARHAPEVYLQAALRRLHAAVEAIAEPVVGAEK